MAKFSATVIVLLCLFTLAAAQTSTENDNATAQVSLPQSEFSHALRLPSDTETDTTTVVVDMTKATFRPINRRFRVRSKKPCHHLPSKVFPTMRENEVIPYGNDMLVASGEKSDFEKPVVHGEEPWVPRRWVRTHHDHHHHDEDSDSDSDDDDDDEEDQLKNKKKKIVFKRFDFDGFGRDKELKQNELMVEKKRKKNKGCFFKRVRKFLDRYF